jgi:signal transduction histidine kinase/CheY-like chemotaxis protein/HPt (histidine-containing phosphotransfer) domain-containing protein
MPIKHFFRRTKFLVTRSLYAQVLVVILAFTLMVVSSYLIMSEREKVQLRRNVKDAISYTEAQLKAELLEPETMLGGISETIRDMIIRGNGSERILEYLVYINDYMRTAGDKHMAGVIGFYGVFDVYGGKFFSGTRGWELPEGYDLTVRPWYTAAAQAAGGVIVTQPYVDIYSTDVIISFARRIFDRNGRPLGTIGLDVGLDQIRQRAVDTQFAENGYGFLLSENLELIAHPDPSMLGMMFRDIHSRIVTYENELVEKGSVSEAITTDYRGIESIVFIQRLQNGWYMGVVTPKGNYYQPVKDMAMILVALGGLLAAILGAILIRIIAEKHRSDERMHLMFDAMPLCANFWDKNFNNIDCNHESVRLFEMSSKQEYNSRFYELSPEYQPDGRLSSEEIDEYLRKAMEEGSCRFEWMHQKLNGEPMPAEITLVRVKYKKENIIIGYTRDLREQKAMLNEIRRENERSREMAKRQAEAESANLAKSAFLAKVSHEIRTPMNAILGITEIQLQDEELAPDMHTAFGKIYDSGYLLLNIINDILDLSKIEAGKLELMPVNYDVASLINDTVHLNIVRFDSKPIEFSLVVDENIPATLFGDELRIKQILNNLLSNAFKYTERGRVVFSVTAEYEYAEQEGEAAPVTVIFRVSDTGQGMTKEQVDKLFEEYTRFNTEANRMTMGTGLGMTIAKALIQMMDGAIFVESEPDKGSVFTVRLPQGIVGGGVLGKEIVENLREFRLGKAAQMEKAPQIVREYMPYGRILVVDDVESNLYVVRGLLAPYGLSIETAMSGPEAIEKIKSGVTYDIVFMDHFMPKMDGIEAAKIIRGLGYARPIVALTANALTGQAEMFMEHGFDGFISKPIDIRQLNATLNKLVRDKQPPEAIEAAQRLKAELKKHSARSTKQGLDPQLAEIFVRDAQKAASALEMFREKRDVYGEEDLQSYIINVHAMKSALANVGETALSAFAFRLEQAGRGGDFAVISDETSAFLDELRAAAEKLKPKEAEPEGRITGEDQAFLEKQLAAIQAACAEYDKKAAKDALAVIREKTWPRPVREQLNAIAEHLLHSEFEEASQTAGDIRNIKTE